MGWNRGKIQMETNIIPEEEEGASKTVSRKKKKGQHVGWEWEMTF